MTGTRVATLEADGVLMRRKATCRSTRRWNPKKLWEGLDGAVAEVFNNQGNDRLATRISLEGRLERPDVQTWEAIAQVLRNAFIQALKHVLEKPSDA